MPTPKLGKKARKRRAPKQDQPYQPSDPAKYEAGRQLGMRYRRMRDAGMRVTHIAGPSSDERPGELRRVANDWGPVIGFEEFDNWDTVQGFLAGMKIGVPLCDQGTVYWHGRTLHLGETYVFDLLAKLVERSGEMVPYVALPGGNSTKTLHARMRDLKASLREGDMSDLAELIKSIRRRGYRLAIG